MASSPASVRRPVAGGQSGWWLEDAIPGGTIEHLHGRTIDAAEHVWLAWITDNVSDVHGDAHRAATGAFGQPLVLGALTAAIVIGLAEPAVSDPAFVAHVVPRGWRSITLHGPVVAGDTLRARSLVSTVTAAGPQGWGLVSRVITGYNQRGEVVAVVEELDRGVASRS